jgi:hypothetical protein
LRILFLVHNLGKTRHFEGVIHELTARKHTVVLGAVRKRKALRATKVLHDNVRVEVAQAPARRIDGWQEIALALRRARDYDRFLDPRYARAHKLTARAGEYAPSGLGDAIARRPWLRRRWRLLAGTLALAERVMPTERYFELFIKAERTDLLLVTPLVDFGSYQTDYVKAAHHLGVPVAFLPFSWDNLTNRGLIRVSPDRVIVWNEMQKREAVEMHGVPADRVIVAGAPRFDDFLRLRPSTTREAFCALVGLDPAHPIILYTCSSNFVAPEEVAFVRAWIAQLREGPDERLRHCGVLVRPHPAHPEEWERTDVSGLPGVAIWSHGMSLQADQGLYDSLHHCAAVVGLNTSAMIEAAIVGRPVFTVTAPEFSGGQQGTLHFSYLLVENGGILTAAEGFAQHLPQLAAAVRGEDNAAERSTRFVSTFVRPRGLELPAAPIMADEVIRAGALRKPRRRAAFWHYPLRWALRAAAGRMVGSR